MCFALIFIVLLLSTSSAVAEPLTVKPLKVKPERCIALHQGQYCYQTLKFSWVMANPSRYCLYMKSFDEPLACWDGQRLQSFRFEFKSMQDESFFIRDESTNQMVDEVKVDVAWVYKSSKKVSTGWRLF